MAATMQQFVKEVSPILKQLYANHKASRADYKSAVEAYSVKKMPKGSEDDRRKFVDWACRLYDLMKRAGVEPDRTVTEWGEALSKMVN
jgi:hypothetical protein